MLDWLNRNHKSLGVVIAVIAGAWALFTYFDSMEDEPPSAQTEPSAEADTGIANTGTQVFEGDVNIGGEPTEKPE